MSESIKNLKYDLPASLVVFLVALPLCLGIALASGATPFAGIISGVIGGLVVGALSGSNLSVSGPAAGLTVIVLNGIAQVGSYDAFLLAVVISGIFQIILGFVGAGMVGSYFPNSVIKGMLAAIGLILIFKQIPHALGVDKVAEGDESFHPADQAIVDGVKNGSESNTFLDIVDAVQNALPGATIISLFCLGLGILWGYNFFKKNAILKYIPGPLIMVISGVVLNELLGVFMPEWQLKGNHLVNVPMEGFGQIVADLSHPNFGAIGSYDVWLLAATIAIIASLETLLSVDAADKMDPQRRLTPLNRELKAQGVGNLLCGLIGGIPVTAVIVRSSANIAAGGRTKISAISHGVLLVLAVLLIPSILNKIPLAALAAVLLQVGYKLTTPTLYKYMYNKGLTTLIPFLVTIIAILFTDLLKGIGVGIAVGLFLVLRSNFTSAIFLDKDGNKYFIRFNKDVSFLNKARLRKVLTAIPKNSYVEINNEEGYFLDADIIETIEDFASHARHRNIEVKMGELVKRV
jgi:MFS superfamily sulfate permease-like transporter